MASKPDITAPIAYPETNKLYSVASILNWSMKTSPNGMINMVSTMCVKLIKARVNKICFLVRLIQVIEANNKPKNRIKRCNLEKAKLKLIHAHSGKQLKTLMKAEF